MMFFLNDVSFVWMIFLNFFPFLVHKSELFEELVKDEDRKSKFKFLLTKKISNKLDYIQKKEKEKEKGKEKTEEIQQT